MSSSAGAAPKSWPIGYRVKHDPPEVVAAHIQTYKPKPSSRKVLVPWPPKKFQDSPMKEWGALLKPRNSDEDEGPIYFRCLADPKCRANEVYVCRRLYLIFF